MSLILRTKRVQVKSETSLAGMPGLLLSEVSKWDNFETKSGILDAVKNLLPLLRKVQYTRKQPVYLHSLLATLLPSHSLRSNKGISLSVPRVKTNTGTRTFHSCAPSLWNNLCCLSIQAFHLLPSRNIWRHISLTWPFPRRHWHALWPVDVTELTISLILLSNPDLAVAPLSLTLSGILVL